MSSLIAILILIREKKKGDIKRIIGAALERKMIEGKIYLIRAEFRFYIEDTSRLTGVVVLAL